jgi:hypothetical protein
MSNITAALNVETLQAFARENKPIAETVCLAQAFAELETERVMAYIKPLFATFEFYRDLDGDEDGERITDLDQLYLSKDDEQARAFYDAADAAHREHGFDGEKDIWPNLVAESMHTDAENCLLQAFAEFIGVSPGRFYGKLRAQALDLLMRICLQDSNAHDILNR